MSRRDEYEKDLREQQRRHLDATRQGWDYNWTPCMHDSCPRCHGTGVKLDGSECIHGLCCPCPKCSPRCAAV